LKIFARKEIGSEFVVDNKIVLDRLETISSRQQKSFVFTTPRNDLFYASHVRLVDVHRIAMRLAVLRYNFCAAHAGRHDVTVYYIAVELFNFNPTSHTVLARPRDPPCAWHTSFPFSRGRTYCQSMCVVKVFVVQYSLCDTARSCNT